MKFLKLLVVIAVLAAIAAAFMYFKGIGPMASMKMEINDSIEDNGQLVTDMKAIKQWEFLVINEEEVIDSVIKGRIYDDVLVRIYYGSLHLGVDLAEMADSALQISGDTVIAQLPPIKLLDERFIDEARTQAFYEKGTWKDEAKGKLLNKADRVMRKNCLTKENFKLAEENGMQQMESFFRSLGFNHVAVSFASPVNQKEVKY